MLHAVTYKCTFLTMYCNTIIIYGLWLRFFNVYKREYSLDMKHIILERSNIVIQFDAKSYGKMKTF